MDLEMNPLLEVKNLSVVFETAAGEVHALNEVSFHLSEGEIIGVVGESGSGKTVAMLSVMRLLAENARVRRGEILFKGQSLRNLDEKAMCRIRGKEIGMIFQDPMTSLNPLFKIGIQVREAILAHQSLSTKEAQKKAIAMLRRVGIPDPEKSFRQYPHEFSGGMRQRIMIAIALCSGPKLLIADEPTTALDVTIQANILLLLKELQQKSNLSIILITHDLGLVADICSRVVVMYGGTVVEQGTVDQIFYRAKHPYTQGLLKSIPGRDLDKTRLTPIEGQPPNMLYPPQGCPFEARCKSAFFLCPLKKPELRIVAPNHQAACWLLDACVRGSTWEK